ncbi:MAG: UDP binding domain-containing protein, partial [Patescibacteria group bacterium]
VVWHLKSALGNNLKNKKIAVLGIAFKPDTDDIRESPAFPIIESLLGEGAKISAHDPEVFKHKIPEELKVLPIHFSKTIAEALKNADGVIVVTAWKQYKDLKPAIFKQYMKKPVVIDGRRIYDKAAFSKAGILYKGIGA